jgi:PAS domain S-box-containing protein
MLLAPEVFGILILIVMLALLVMLGRRWRADSKWRGLLADLPLPCFLYDRQGRILFANKAASCVYGYSCEELQARNLQSLESSAFAESFARRQALLDADGEWRGEGEHLDQSGRTFSVDLVNTPVSWKRTRAFVLLVRDLGSQRSKAESLREAQSHGTAEPSPNGPEVEGILQENGSNMALPASGPSSLPRGNPETRGTVLVVDDETLVRGVAKTMLEIRGFDVLTAGDGEEGVEVFRDHADQILAVLLDVTMPRMGGEEAFREMRRIRPDVKVVLSSGYSEKDAKQYFDESGLAGYIQKPFEMKILVDTFRRIQQESTS